MKDFINYDFGRGKTITSNPDEIKKLNSLYEPMFGGKPLDIDDNDDEEDETE